MGRRSRGSKPIERENTIFMEDNHRLMSMFFALKLKIKDVLNEFGSFSKFVKVWVIFSMKQGLRVIRRVLTFRERIHILENPVQFLLQLLARMMVVLTLRCCILKVFITKWASDLQESEYVTFVENLVILKHFVTSFMGTTNLVIEEYDKSIIESL